MKTKILDTSKSLFLVIIFIAGTQIYFSCSPKITVPKALTFTDVEKEFHFAKPLPESSKQVILKQFGTVQNYHDSIIARRNNPHYKNIIVTGHPTKADSAAFSIFNMSEEELKRKGVKVTIDPNVKNIMPEKSK